MSRKLRILTWHIHGSYLFYLAQTGHEFILPVRDDRSAGYGGRTRSYPWPDTIREIPAHEVRRSSFDCVLYQSRANYLNDQHEILSPEQLKLPRLYLEHDPPRDHPTDTRHPVDDPDVPVVHVTSFNELMWDCGRSPTQVIDHGVTVPEGVLYTGEIERGLVVVNHIRKRGRRLGFDIFEDLKKYAPLDLVGMGWEEAGGVGEIRHCDLPSFQARYRFFLNPIRYTSLGLALCEAMMVGMPIVGLATTEAVTVIENGVSGFLSTDPTRLRDAMALLIKDRKQAASWGAEARKTALERFHIERFKKDWNHVFHEVTT
jgi:glycosyltransferase involved in cell wall biosynthesis